MKKYVCFFCFILSAFIFFSCKSASHFPVPGERKITRDAIYAEYLAIADAYADLEKYDKAIQYYNLALENKDVYWQTIYKLAHMYAYAKNWSEAEKLYTKLLERDSQNVNLQLSLAYLQAMSGNVDKAIVSYKKIISENEDAEDALTNYIAILLATGRYELAESEVNILKEKFPESKRLSEFEKKLSENLK
ncbi:MAG: tetratricopeptide repeat protein [Treponema sp.]|nr:tetratricopeptide repeat protein [Treponema sp.]